MMDRNRLYIYPDVDTLAAAFVCEFSKFLVNRSENDTPLHVALSGGSTPLVIFRHLSEATRPEDWSGVHLYWGDERCVASADPQSNFGQAQKILIAPMGLQEDQVHRIVGEHDPDQESKRYGRFLTEMLPVENGIPVFDWIWLGLGEDGHTLSIFPDQIELWKSDEHSVITTHPQSGQKRITLTGGVVNAARRVSFIVTGRNKRKVVREIIKSEGGFMNLPASYVAPLTGEVEWYLDQEAASGL